MTLGTLISGWLYSVLETPTRVNDRGVRIREKFESRSAWDEPSGIGTLGGRDSFRFTCELISIHLRLIPKRRVDLTN